MAYCRGCGRRRRDEELSRRGYCGECIERRVSASVDQITRQAGPIYRRYAAGMARAGREVRAPRE